MVETNRQPSKLEQRLIEAVVQGELLDLAEDEHVDEAAMRSWGPERTVRAWVVRDIVRGRLATEPDPRGLRLRGARIAGRLDLENIVSDLALTLSGCFLPDGLILRDARLFVVALSECRIGHPIGSTDAPIDGIRLTARLIALDGSTVTADSLHAVQLLDAHIGQLVCTGAQLSNRTGPALTADRLQIDQGMYLHGGFTAAGSGELGAVRLIGAHIRGRLDCTGAKLSNPTGPALTADDLQVDRSVFLCDGFTAHGTGEFGTIHLPGAHIGGQLNCTGAKLSNPAGPALAASGLQVGQNMFLRGGFTATGTGHAVIDLDGARIGGHLTLKTRHVTRASRDSGPLVALDGMTYPQLPDPDSLPYWLRLLRQHTPRYAAQPYQQLAAVHRAAGHDHAVRRILMAQRDDQIHRRAISGWDRNWAQFTGILLGYGYQPWRALLGLLLVLVVSIGWTWTAAQHHGLVHTSRTATPGAACTATELIGVGLDLGTPLLKTGARDTCAPTARPAGQSLAIAGWPLQVLAWAFTALFIAGFTSAVRKTVS
ncbi:hypothetical protein ACQP2X_39460 [Actinoplanes sp. CA-131856]